MPDKCAAKVCEPHKDGRQRVCNPETGRCKLKDASTSKKPKAGAKAANRKPKAVAKTTPMTLSEVLTHIDKSGKYDEEVEDEAKFLDKRWTREARYSLQHFGKFVVKYGATKVDGKLMAKLLAANARNPELVVYDTQRKRGSQMYRELEEKRFEVMTATQLDNKVQSRGIPLNHPEWGSVFVWLK